MEPLSEDWAVTLTAETVNQVVERFQRLLGGKRFSFVEKNEKSNITVTVNRCLRKNIGSRAISNHGFLIYICMSGPDADRTIPSYEEMPDSNRPFFAFSYDRVVVKHYDEKNLFERDTVSPRWHWEFVVEGDCQDNQLTSTAEGSREAANMLELKKIMRQNILYARPKILLDKLIELRESNVLYEKTDKTTEKKNVDYGTYDRFYIEETNPILLPCT